jgi:hypothetical protein
MSRIRIRVPYIGTAELDLTYTDGFSPSKTRIYGDFDNDGGNEKYKPRLFADDIDYRGNLKVQTSEGTEIISTLIVYPILMGDNVYQVNGLGYDGYVIDDSPLRTRPNVDFDSTSNTLAYVTGNKVVKEHFDGTKEFSKSVPEFQQSDAHIYVDPSGEIFTTSYFRCRHYDSETGELNWTFEPASANLAKAAAPDLSNHNVLYVTGYDEPDYNLYRVDVSDGSVLDQTTLHSASGESSLQLPGLAVSDDNSRILVTIRQDSVYMLDNNFSTITTFTAPTQTIGSTEHNTADAGSEAFYFQTDNGVTRALFDGTLKYKTGTPASVATVYHDDEHDLLLRNKGGGDLEIRSAIAGTVRSRVNSFGSVGICSTSGRGVE